LTSPVERCLDTPDHRSTRKCVYHKRGRMSPQRGLSVYRSPYLCRMAPWNSKPRDSCPVTPGTSLTVDRRNACKAQARPHGSPSNKASIIIRPSYPIKSQLLVADTLIGSGSSASAKACLSAFPSATWMDRLSRSWAGRLNMLLGWRGPLNQRFVIRGFL
jgi:hypothetical protein